VSRREAAWSVSKDLVNTGNRSKNLFGPGYYSLIDIEESVAASVGRQQPRHAGTRRLVFWFPGG
jgi:hypothetical protein